MNLYDYATELDVLVKYANLTKHKLNGMYDHQERTIWLNKGMNHVLERCTLAHELGHAHYGDIASQDKLYHSKIEQRADQYAARLLISFDAYKDAEKNTAGTVGAIARELDVTTDLVAAYQQQLARLGAAVYLGAKHGSYIIKELDQ